MPNALEYQGRKEFKKKITIVKIFENYTGL